jgi:predicted Rossmann-fold nucleotide-binding protein
VVGIIPQALVDKEWAKRDCTELHIVDTMHERKRLMAERADAFLALAGGIGTLEELFEVWTWRQLGYHDKPVGILDTEGYYQPLLAFLDESVRKGFMNDWQMDLVRWAPSPRPAGSHRRKLAGRSTACRRTSAGSDALAAPQRARRGIRRPIRRSRRCGCAPPARRW